MCPPSARLLLPGESVVEGDLYLNGGLWLPATILGLVISPSLSGHYCRFLSVESLDKTLGQSGINPKDAVAAAKPDLYLVPPALVIWVAKCMEHGKKKYSAANWRDEDQKVRMTVYLSAALRHLMALADGEDNALDSGLPHAAHAAASMGIILDALACGTLIDDRSRPGPAAKLLDQLTEKKPND